MTGTNFASLIRLYTRTNSTTLTNADIVLLANTVKDDFAKEVIKADEGLFGVSATRDLVASATSREYSLPDDFLTMERLEAELDGSNWIPLTEMTLTQYHKQTTETEIVSQFSNSEGEAFYDIFRRSFFIYSGTVIATTAGMKLWYIAYPADISAGTLSETTDMSLDPTTTTSAIPRPLHELWARKVSILWKSSREKPIPLTEQELNFNVDFRKAISALTNPNKDRTTQASLPSVDTNGTVNDGSEY